MSIHIHESPRIRVKKPFAVGKRPFPTLVPSRIPAKGFKLWGNLGK
jgi:hypothetical protein